MRTTKVTRRATSPAVQDFSLLIDSAKAKTDLVRALGGVPSAAKRAGSAASGAVTGERALKQVGARVRSAAANVSAAPKKRKK